MSLRCEIICVGTELLLGNIVNTDAQDVAQLMAELGINVYYQTVVGDNDARLREAVEIAKQRADLIITTGGLGPTYDDMTKETLAAAFGKRLVMDEAEAAGIRDYLNRHPNGTLTENNYRQAMLPEGCTVLHNDWGTAPGCAFFADNVHVIMLPGPPRECIPMLRYRVRPYLLQLSDSEIVSHNIHVFGMSESAVEARLYELMTRLDNPTLAPYAKEGEVMLRLTAKAETAEAAEALMAPILPEITGLLGDVVYGIDCESLERFLLSELGKRKLTLACAESCTGGLLSKRITDVPGASAVFLGGTVVYANEAKMKLLGVSAETLRTEGAVSRSTALQMARGVRRVLGADLGVGITGIAGPASDDTSKPVGLVYVSIATPDGEFCRELHLSGERARIRTNSAHHALDMLRRYVTGLPVEEI